jgi:hypothetical protein
MTVDMTHILRMHFPAMTLINHTKKMKTKKKEKQIKENETSEGRNMGKEDNCYKIHSSW